MAAPKQTQLGKTGGPVIRPIAENRRIWHEFHILERYEVGLVLTGTEVKSLRMSQVQLAEAFLRIDDREVWVYSMHIAPYTHGNIYNQDPIRKRKVLLKKTEIMRLLGKTKEKGLTLVPLKLYWRGDWAKMEIGLAQGKNIHDKRDSLAKKDMNREVQRALKERSKGD